MSKIISILPLVVLLAACSGTGAPSIATPTAPPPGQVGCLTVECAEQLIEHSRATSVAATAQAQATLDTANLQSTLTVGQAAAEATATAIVAQSIQDSVSATEQSVSKTSTADSGSATAQAQATGQAHATALAETAAAAQLNEQADNQSTVRLVVVLVVLALVALAFSFALGKILWDAQKRGLERERHQQDSELERQRQMVLIMLAGLKTTPHGLVFIDTQTLRPQLMPPTEGATLLRGQPPESEVGEVGHLIINDGEASHIVPKVSPAEEEGRAQMIEFIEAAVAFYGADGLRQNQIPSRGKFEEASSRFGSGAMWQSRRDLFGGWLISRSTGTFCPQKYPTLGEFREAVRQGRVPVHLSQKEAGASAERPVPAHSVAF